MKTNDVNKIDKAIKLHAATFSQVINQFKKLYSKQNIVNSINNWNNICKDSNITDEVINISPKEIADITKLVARKDFYKLVKFGLSSIDGVPCEVVWVEKFSNFDKNDKKINKKYAFCQCMEGEVFKPFGFKTNKSTGEFLREVHSEKTKIQFINKNDEYTTIKYCIEKKYFLHSDIVKVLRSYLAAGCPEIEGIKYSDIKIEKKNGKKDTTEKPKETKRKKSTKAESKAA